MVIDLKKCPGKMIVIERSYCTVTTQCDVCGATDIYSTATPHYYDKGCVKNR